MHLIDTHTHFYLPEFDEDRDEVVASSIKNGVVKLLMPNIDAGSVKRMLAAADRYPGICYPMLGLHPTSVKEDYREQLEELKEILPKRHFTAIGEIGIDLYWDKTFIREQRDSFHKQLSLSVETGLPVVIHSREAFDEIFDILSDFDGKGVRGVFHAFSGGIAEAEKAISAGFYVGIGGIVTFKNSGLDKVVKEIGPDRIVLETDSPWLAPVPHRGRRNESSYISIINRKLAEILDRDFEETASITYNNSLKLFNPG
jgi:TatD DNase family protein